MVKALKEKKAFKAQLDTTKTSLKKEYNVMKNLMVRAIDVRCNKGICMPDCKMLLEWAKVVELEDALTPIRKKRLAMRFLGHVKLRHLLSTLPPLRMPWRISRGGH